MPGGENLLRHAGQYLCPRDENFESGSPQGFFGPGLTRHFGPARAIPPCYCRYQLQVWLPEGLFFRRMIDTATRIAHRAFSDHRLRRRNKMATGTVKWFNAEKGFGLDRKSVV